jgi:hypothetical protein
MGYLLIIASNAIFGMAAEKTAKLVGAMVITLLRMARSFG